MDVLHNLDLHDAEHTQRLREQRARARVDGRRCTLRLPRVTSRARRARR